MPDRPDDLVLHLLRHAHAGDPEAWEGADELRPLSRKGRGQAQRLGRFLAAHDIRPDRIVSSPKVRAVQSAEAVAEALDMAVTVDRRLGAGYDLAALESIVHETGVRAPMLVGHDPDMTFAVAALCAAEGLTMRKGTLATIDTRRPLREGGGQLRWLVPPDLIGGD